MGNEIFSGKLTVLGIKFSVKFAHIILPFDLNILRNVLTNLGYSYEVQPQHRGIMGLELAVGGIARKGDLEIDFNIDKQVLGITGNDYDRVIDAFAELMTTLKQTLHPTELKTSFYETIISATVKGSKSPLETFGSESNEFKKILDLNSTFGEKVSLLGWRLAPMEKPIDNRDWFEYRIDPYIYQPTLLYSILYVFRNGHFETVNKAIYDFKDKSLDVVRCLENT